MNYQVLWTIEIDLTWSKLYESSWWGAKSTDKWRAFTSIAAEAAAE